jgi:acyl-CoA synthetase (AMP-forming)/AMP-acid ligase II
MRRLLHAAPMFHVADLAGWVTQSLVGGTHVMVPKFDPVEVMTAIQRHRVTNTVLVPTMIQLLVDHPDLEPTTSPACGRSSTAARRRVRRCCGGP